MSSSTLIPLRTKIPSKDEMWSVFSVGVFFTHTWGYIWLFYHVPALMMRSTVWEMISVAAYNLVFYLFDSIFIAALILALCLVLPASYLKNHFTLVGSTLNFVFALTAAFINFTAPILSVSLGRIQNHDLQRIITWLCYLGIALWIAFTLMFSRKIGLKTRLSRVFLGTIERITTLSTLFLVLDGIGVLIVCLRNLT